MGGLPLRLAVASKENVSISEHFGHAKAFRIYDVTPAECRFVAHREVAHYCHGNTSDASAMAGILAAIEDCAAVFVARICDGPVEKLRAIGVAAVVDYAYAAIDDSLLDYASRRAAGETPWARSST